MGDTCVPSRIEGSSLGLLHDLVAVEDGEAVGGEGEDEGDQEEPTEREADIADNHAGHAETESLGAPATLSLVRVGADGARAVEDGEGEDEPGELSRAVNELVHLFF